MSTPYIALYPSDYLADTAHLGLTEHGVYWRMLLHYYQHCKPFPNELEKINRVILASTPEEKRVTEYILGEFFTLQRHDDGAMYWHHERADLEISSAESRHLSAVERGKKGGRPRKEAELNLGFTSAKAEPKQPEPEPEPEETIKTEDRAKIAIAIPYQSIVDSYHARLPMCPRVTRISDQRKKMMKARWHSDLHDVAAWDAYFSSVSDSLFLTGRTNGTRPPFFAGERDRQAPAYGAGAAG